MNGITVHCRDRSLCPPPGIASLAIDLSSLPEELSRKLPRHRPCTRTVFRGDSRYGRPQAICEPASSFAMRQSAMNRSRPSRPTPPGLEPPGASGYFSKTGGQSNAARAAHLPKSDCPLALKYTFPNSCETRLS